MDDSFLEGDEGKAPVAPTAIKQVADVARSLRQLDARIEAKEAELKELNKQRAEIVEQTLPSIMQANGVTDMSLVDEVTGKRYQLAFNEDIYLRIPVNDEGRKEAFKFLIDNGAGYLIKEQLVVEDATEGLRDALRSMELPYEEKQNVNTNSLQAWGRAAIGLKKGSQASIELSDFPKCMSPYLRRTAELKEKK